MSSQKTELLERPYDERDPSSSRVNKCGSTEPDRSTAIAKRRVEAYVSSSSVVAGSGQTY